MPAEFEGFSSEPSIPQPRIIPPGTSDSVSTLSVVDTVFGDATQTFVEYVYHRTGAPMGRGNGVHRAETFD